MKNNIYLSGLKTAVFDIETTGLYPSSDNMVLGGIYSVSDQAVIQHFAEDPSQEAEVIQKTLDDLRQFDAVITYNGDSFDWPFLFRRAGRYGIPTNRTPYQSIDLYRWLKLYWPQAALLPSLKQKSVEVALGLSESREDRISGAQSAQLYRKYVLTKEPDDKRAMLLHNRDDLSQLFKIADTLSFLPYHRIAAEQGFLIKGASRNIHINKINWTGLRLTASGLTDKGLLPASIYGSNYDLEYDPGDGSLTFHILCEQREGLTFADLNALPVSSEKFEAMGGFHHGRLVLKDAGQTFDRSVCTLIRESIEALMKEELNI
ncbi:MAG TPA: hypothetical protein DF480_00535 [Clostridiales bacterium]|nr:hypothetical protein [Clostridiales bacterium]